MCFGHGYEIPKSAREVASAFYRGKKRTKTNCYTDGRRYVLMRTTIANRLLDEDIPIMVERSILGEKTTSVLSFSFGGWPTQMTCRHLLALGVNAEIKKGLKYGPRGGKVRSYDVPCMNGVAVEIDRFYTPDELEQSPKWEQPVWKKP